MKLYNQWKHKREKKLHERDKAMKAARLKEAMDLYKPDNALTNAPGRSIVYRPDPNKAFQKVEEPHNPHPFLDIPYLMETDIDYEWKPATPEVPEYGNFERTDTSDTGSSNDSSPESD